VQVLDIAWPLLMYVYFLRLWKIVSAWRMELYYCLSETGVHDTDCCVCFGTASFYKSLQVLQPHTCWLACFGGDLASAGSIIIENIRNLEETEKELPRYLGRVSDQF
jgi:hypothetical protein